MERRHIFTLLACLVVVCVSCQEKYKLDSNKAFPDPVWDENEMNVN